MAVRQLSALLKGIKSKHHGDIYCSNCFHSFRIKNKHESHNEVRENKDFCIVFFLLKTLKYQNLISTKNVIKHHLFFMQVLNV